MSVEQADPGFQSWQPGNQPPWGQPPSGNGPSKRRALIVAISVLVLVAAVVTFGVLATLGDEDAKPRPTAKPAPPAWTQEAGRQLAALPGLRYSGTITVSGRPVQVRLSVTRSGLATGTLTAGTMRAELVAVDGSTYVRGGSAFWLAYSGEAARASSFAGRWAKLPLAIPGLAKLGDVLSPKGIAASLSTASAKTPTQNLGATPTYRAKTSKAIYFVTVTAPYRLVRVQGTGQGGPQLAAAPLTDTVQAFTEIRPRVAALGGAADPALRFQPGEPDFVNCDDNSTGCTLSVQATLTSPSGAVPAGARAAIRATITAEGRTLGSCTGSAPVPAGRSVEVRCKVSGRGWQAWLAGVREEPGPHPYEGHARVLGEAVPASDVKRLLNLVDRERSEQVGAPVPAPSSTP